MSLENPSSDGRLRELVRRALLGDEDASRQAAALSGMVGAEVGAGFRFRRWPDVKPPGWDL